SESAEAQIDAADELAWLGLSDPRLFDIIEKNLKAHAMDVDKPGANYAAWMAKGLAYSGNDKYRATLEDVAANAGHKNTRKHATNALELLAQHKRWNPIITGNGQAISGLSIEQTGYANMLKSGDYELQRIAAKRIYHERIRNSFLLGLLLDETQKALAKEGMERDEADAAAHMLKALATTSDPKYRALVEDTAANNKDKNLRKWAERYLKSYY
ncbi:MAG TPA: hypothetical protein VIN71_11450, partial [Pseudomonadales bacterium]